MIEIHDPRPDVHVLPAEYQRLLGYPRDRVLEDRARELADWTRAWYEEHGRPWVYARQLGGVRTEGSVLHLGARSFRSPRLVNMLRSAAAESVVLAAVSAGPEIEQEAHARWQDGKPDEYFFLEVYGSAVVEQLVTATGARLCAWADAHGLAVLPHYSPGYPDWDIGEQPYLLELIQSTAASAGAAPPLMDVLESGMLRPKKSLLAVFGLTRQTDRVRRLTDLVPCTNCSYAPCQYRRAPYRRAAASSNPELVGYADTGAGSGDGGQTSGTVPPTSAAAAVISPLVRDAKYSINEKALRRWSQERLSVATHDDGSIHATFRYDGTTCTNMGRPMTFHYRIALGPASDRYRIREQHCGPAPGDEGHTCMCQYRTNADQLMASIAQETPLLGRPLDAILTWSRSHASTGCYCEPDSRQHKWGLVLETLHYTLANGLASAADPGARERTS
jgi:hypothetical protein